MPILGWIKHTLEDISKYHDPYQKIHDNENYYHDNDNYYHDNDNYYHDNYVHVAIAKMVVLLMQIVTADNGQYDYGYHNSKVLSPETLQTICNLGVMTIPVDRLAGRQNLISTTWIFNLTNLAAFGKDTVIIFIIKIIVFKAHHY